MAFVLRPLAKGDDRSSFRSTNAELERWFSAYAAQNQFRYRVAVTYVCDEADIGIIAYMALTVGSIRAEDYARAGGGKFPPYPLPVLKLARLATAVGYEGRGCGSALLRFAMGQALKLSLEVGCVGIATDAKPESISFYSGRAFVPLEVEQTFSVDEASAEDDGETRAMFLSMKKIVAASES